MIRLSKQLAYVAPMYQCSKILFTPRVQIFEKTIFEVFDLITAYDREKVF